MKILWCITGAGQFLAEVCDFLENSAGRNRVTVAFSKAGLEVSPMYGVFDKITKNSADVILEDEQGASAPFIGRLAKKEYDIVVIAPCTANTTAKIAHGIADSLVSNFAAQALKSRIPVYVLPTDEKRIQKTRIPINIDIKKCRNCKSCKAMEKCPNSAFFISDRIRVNLLNCNACKKCIEFCKYEAISFGREITINSRKIDMDNVKKIKKMDGIKVIKNIKEIKKFL